MTSKKAIYPQYKKRIKTKLFPKTCLLHNYDIVHFKAKP